MGKMQNKYGKIGKNIGNPDTSILWAWDKNLDPIGEICRLRW